MRNLRGLRHWPGSRWAVLAGAAVTLSLFAQQLSATNASFYAAFMKSVGGGLLVLAVVSVAKQLWHGADVNQLGVPGGPQVGIKETADATEETVETLNRRITSQMDDVNQRLYDLEKSVFKDGMLGTDQE